VEPDVALSRPRAGVVLEAVDVEDLDPIVAVVRVAQDVPARLAAFHELASYLGGPEPCGALRDAEDAAPPA
jgi:hypothetical protein